MFTIKSLPLLSLSLSLLNFITFSAPLSSKQPSDPKKIAITQIVSHPSLNAIRQGIIKELAKEGFTEHLNLEIIFKDAQANPTIAAQIAKYLSTLDLDLAIPISTPSAQTVVKYIHQVPVVFAAVTDPIAAKIVHNLKHPNGNVTGIMDRPPLEKQIPFILKIVPKLKTLGYVYNPGEINNVSTLKQLEIIAKKYAITIIAAPTMKSSDIRQTALGIASQVDGIFVGNDNTIVSGLEALVKVCLDHKLPLFMSDPESVTRGALAALAYDQEDIGREVGKIAVQILQGKDPGTIPVETPKKLIVSTNTDTAKKIGITFPPNLRNFSNE